MKKQSKQTPGPKVGENKIHGRIVSFSMNHKWGFVRADDAPDDKSQDKFLHYSQIKDGTPLAKVKANCEVMYALGRVSENPRICAVNVEVFQK